MATARVKLTRGESNVAWLEGVVRVPDGPYVGKRLKLTPHLVRLILAIYDNPPGRKTRRIIFSLARKNAKTVAAACIMLLHLCGPEHQRNSQLYSTALSREQAAVVFNYAAKMVRLSPDLRAVVAIIESKKTMTCPELGTMYRALSADAPTAFGLNPALCIHDELGQVKGPTSDLYNAIESAMGAQESPLSVIISTQAPNDGDLLSILIDDAAKGDDPETKLILYTTPIDEDPFTEEAIRKANPAYDYFMNKTEVLAAMKAAMRMPSQEPSYRNLNLNQRVQATAPFISKSLWEANGGKPDELDGMDIYGGLDLSSVADLTSLELIGTDGEAVHVESLFWLPGDTIRELSKRDRTPYDQWADEGYIELTPGSAIEYEYVAKKLREIFDRYGDNIRAIAFDRWAWRFLRPWLVKEGFTEDELEKFKEFGQGMRDMGPATRRTEALFLNKRIRHGMHPVLTMCAKNAVAYTDAAGGRKLVKDKSHGRIDGMVSLVMAIGVAGEAVDADDILDFLADPLIA